METGTTSSKAKLITGLILLVLAVLVFIWMIWLVLTPIDEAQRKEAIPASSLIEDAPAALPQTGVQ